MKIFSTRLVIKNICYKNKTIYFSSLLLTTSIVCPLISCGSDDTSNDIGGFDKEFGFDAQTYNNLERQFTTKYGASLRDKTADENEYINKFENFLQNDLAILRNKLFDPAKNYSFTIRTNTLLDYASKNFNIQLNRNANISEVDFDNLKQSSLENFVIYMENMGFNNVEIDEKKVEFNNTFDEILEKCKSKTSDNAQILMQLQADVIDCWQDLNDEFAHMSAYNHLKKFFDEYEFVVKDQSDKKNDNYSPLLWDNLLKNSDFMGSKENVGKIDQDINTPIDDKWINNLFSISKILERKKDEDDSTCDKLNDTSANKIPDFNSEKIIPGYIFTPVLKTMSQDIYSNNYYMNIDWQLMSNTYKNKEQEIKDKVTAHLACNNDRQMVNVDNYSSDINDDKFSSNNYQFTRYSLMATPEYQQEKMIEAYFDRTKEPDQKITFSWNKDMVGIESFLKSDSIGANGECNLPQDEYKISMSRNNLSLIGLQLNGTNLSDLLNKKNNLQDKQSTNNANNDDNLKIEEKFVKYCDINADAIVSFSDNKISNNSIQNKFIVAFTNTETKHNVEMKSTMNNIGPSKIFSINAVNFYEIVINYVDGKKIQDEIESQHWLATVIWIELGILFSIIVILLILTLVQYKQLFYIGHGITQKIILEPFGRDESNIKFNFKCIIFLSITTISLCLLWKFAISDPISKEVDKIKKWNEMITNRSKSDHNYKINVIDKVNGEDKDIFKTADDFMKYYKTNSNSAFASYFYYFHFVELLQKLTDDESSIILTNTDVEKDYNDFNDNRKKTCNINDKIFARSIVAVLSFILIVYFSYMVYYNFGFTRDVISWRKDWNVQFDHDWENNVDNVRDGVQELRDYISNRHNPFHANYNQPVDAAHEGNMPL